MSQNNTAPIRPAGAEHIVTRKLKRIEAAVKAGDDALLARARKAIGFYGRPGCGKSTIPVDVTEALGFDAVMTFPAQSEPQDIAGFPYPNVEEAERRFMEMLPTGAMERIINATSPTVVVLDDIDKCQDIAMINACGQLTESRMMNNKEISPYVMFIYTGNTMEYNCGGKPLPDHVTTRQIMYIMETNSEDFIHWGVRSRRIMPDVIAYHRLNSKAVFDWTPEISGQNEAYATPRSWERLSDELRDGEIYENYGKSNEMLITEARSTAYGCVGAAQGSTWLSWMTMRKEMPNVNDCVNRPLDADVPDNAAVLHTLVNTLAGMSNDENIGSICDYVDRLPRDFKKCFSMDVCAIAPKARNNSSFITFETAIDIDA